MKRNEEKENRGKLLTPSKAAELYGLERSQIYWWVRQRRFPVIKLEKSVLFWESEFLQFVEQNTIPVADEMSHGRRY